MKNTRLSKQCWRCKYFSDNLPEHFKAIASASGHIEKMCAHGQAMSAPPPCPQFIALSNKKDTSLPYATKSYGKWKQRTDEDSSFRKQSKVLSFRSIAEKAN
jgi:hypothetical protein